MAPVEVLVVCPCGAEVKGNPRLAKDRRRKYCSPACSGRYNGGAAVVPPVLASVRCPCGTEFEVNRNTARGRRRKYCSRACVGRHNGARPPARPASSHCRRCDEPMTVDNVYVDKDGRRHCKNCKHIRNRGRSRGPAVRKPKPKATAQVRKSPPPVKAEPVDPAPARRWLVAPGFGADVPVRRTQ